MSLKINTLDLSLIIILSTILVAAFFIFFSNINTPWQHFSNQATAFLEGRLDVNPLSFDQHDYVVKDQKYYWPEGPFPSILLIPFQLIFGTNFHQGTMQLFLIALLSLMIFKLAKLKNFDNLSSFYLTASFLLGSTVSGLILDPKSWYFAQVLALALLTALVLELETKRRWVFIGILEALLLATRPTAGFIIFALIPILLTQKNKQQKKWINILIFLLPILLVGLSLMWFNYARFSNPLDNGYLTNRVSGYIAPLRNLGLFNLQHIPTNFYFYFLAGLEPITSQISVHLQFPFFKYNVWGLSLFLVAPFFLFSLRSLKINSLYLKTLWIVVVLTLLIQLMYYAPGWYQYGPRYTADFMPILFLLTLFSLKPPKLTNPQKIIITLSCLFNIYLLATPYLS